MARCLVTGGAGFIGSHLADELLRRGHLVVVLDDLSGGSRQHVAPAALFVEGSITDTALLARLFAAQSFDYVFHAAAYAAEGLSHFIRRFNYENNLIGSINLINLAVRHEVKCFVFTSSIAVYGRSQVPMREDMVPIPEDPYGIAKYAVELDLRAAHDMFGLEYVVFRPHNVYGERQNLSDPYRNVVGIFINQLLSGRPLTIFGDGTQTRAFTHIADVAPWIARSVEQAGARNQVLNIGADRACTINQLVEWLGNEFGIAPRVEHLPPRNEVAHAWASHELARTLLGVSSEVSVQEGLRRMVAWARSIERQTPSRFGKIEIERGLPESWRSH